jgi:NhaA family Na+:H+ antiporter
MREHDSQAPQLPHEPIDRILGPLERFLHIEAAGGIVLLLCAVVALGLANSPFGAAYHHFWETEIGFHVGALRLVHSLEHWINDGLMVVFFFVVGLEVKRELVLGELRDPRRAALPIVAALGGMVVPAAIYLALQGGGPAARGWGIPMATDIAFVVGCMALLGARVPPGLRVMLLSLAIADDVGAILVIAVGYSAGIHALPLLLGFAAIAVVLVLQVLGVRSFAVYVAMGVLVWLGFLHSGVHATVAGVILGLLTPARPHVGAGVFGSFLRGATERLHGEAPQRAAHVRSLQRATRETISPLEYLENALHPWVGFVIMPIFALANAGVPFRAADLADPVALAVAAGLVIGKPVGIAGFSWFAVRTGIARLPAGVGWPAIVGGGFLAGMGFTMALFIAGLALHGEAQAAAKVGILGASALAAGAGMLMLRWVLPAPVGARS